MDPTFLPAHRLSELVRSGAMSCRELLDHCIARIERLDGRINAVVVRDFDRARARAAALDRQADKTAPLFGVPMTVKESFDVVGLPTTRGHAALKDRPAQATSLAVRRLEQAGAVVFGKTNVPVDLADWQSFNPVYGSTANPWDLTRTPGGSSGGSAAALAAGLSALEFGSDIGGSIRVPAHYCGVYGHKPSWALCPNFGDPATSRAAPTDIAVIGPLARSAADLALALDAVAGPDPDESGLRIVLPPPRRVTLRGLRVALWAEQAGQPTDPETVAALYALGDQLERAGAVVDRAARPALDPQAAYQLYLQLLSAAWSTGATEAALQRQREARERLAPGDTSADAVMLRGVDMTHRQWLGLNEQRMRLRRAWTAFFRDWDVLLCPVVSSAAFPHMQQGETWERRISIAGCDMAYNDMLFWPGLTGGCHLPATVAPIGQTQGGHTQGGQTQGGQTQSRLPLGVQIVGPLYGDRTTIAVAGLLEEAFGGFRPPPGY